MRADLQMAFKQFRTIFLVSCLVLIAITVLISSVMADDQSCGNLDVPGCGKWPASTPDNERCLPTVEYLTANVESYNSTTHQITICVSVKGTGLVGYGSSTNFSVAVYYAVDSGSFIGGAHPWGGCTTPGDESAPHCVKCVDPCLSRTITADPGNTIRFWATANQMSTCFCTSEVITVAVPSGNVPDTIPVPIPVAAELGPIPCEAQIGDPINASNGNLHFARNDCALETDLGQELSLARHYNSYPFATSPSFSPGWRHSLEYDLAYNASAGKYTLTEGSGRQLVFKKHVLVSALTTVVSYDSPDGVPYRFSADTTAGIYTITMADGSKVIFNGLGPADALSDRAGNTISLSYSGSVLSSATNSSGRAVTFNYNTSGKLSSISSGTLPLATYEYDPTSGQLKRVTYPDNSWEEYSYSTDPGNQNRITSITSSNSHGRFYEYDTDGRAIEYSLAGGKEKDSLSWSVEESTCPDSINTVSDGRAGKFTSFWSADRTARRVIKRENADCSDCEKTIEYDGGGFVKSITDADNIRNEFSRDSRGNIVLATRGANTALAQQTTAEYLTSFNLPKNIRRQSVAKSGDFTGTGFVYDDSGNLTSLVDSVWTSPTTRNIYSQLFTYNSSGQILTHDGPRTDVTDVTTFTYYIPSGDLNTIVAPNGDVTEFGLRNDLGQRTWVRSPSGDTTRFTFDTRGRLTKLVRVAGTTDSAISTYSYNVDGDLLTATNPRGGTITLHRDAAGNIDWIMNGFGGYIEYTYDAWGNPTSEKVYDMGDNLRREESYTHTTKNQLDILTDALSHTTDFDYTDVGDISRVVNALGTVDSSYHDPLRRVIRNASATGTADYATTKYEYDLHDNVTKITDPEGFEYVYKYDDRDRLTYSSSAVTGVTTFSYDPADNLVSETNANGDAIAYTYDAMNRLLSKTYPDGQNVTYVYDGTQFPYGKGKLFTETTNSGVTKYRYDKKGRLLQEIRTFTGDTKVYSTTYDYDKNDNPTVITLPSGVSITYGYDNTNNVTGMACWRNGVLLQSLASSLQYAPFGPQTYHVLGNGIGIRAPVDNRYLVDSILTLNWSTPQVWNYSEDQVGNITSITDGVLGTRNRSFEYDRQDRLKTATSPDFPLATWEFNYSRNGNRTLVTANTPTSKNFVYSYTNNRLSSIDDGTAIRSFSHSSTGDVISQSGITYVYNDAGLLVLAADGPDTTTFGYDGFRRRITATTGTTTTKFINNSSGQVMSEFDGSGNWLRDYAYLNGKLVAMIRPNPAYVPPDTIPNIESITPPGGGEEMSLLEGGATLEASAGTGGGGSSGEPLLFYYYINDHLGTPWYLTDKSKGVAWSARYYPSGELYFETVSSQTQRYRLPGQYHDQATGLYYNWHRYYDPTVGRYYQADPIGMAGGINQYSYAYNNPVYYIDPDGRVVPLIVGAVWGAWEIGSSLWDAWSTVETLRDSCATGTDKFIAAAAFVGGIFLPGGGYGGAYKAAKGQVHHAISRKVYRELERHPNLKGLYTFRDPRFATQAIDDAAHRGYQTWHRRLGEEIVQLVRDRGDLTAKEFEQILKQRYSLEDMMKRFPGGL